MGANFWWIYDAVSVFIIFFSIYRCSKKGFSRIVVTAIGCAVSLIAAFTISKSTAGVVYDKFLKESNIEAVRTALKDYRPEDTVKAVIEENELSGIMNNDDIKDILGEENSPEKLYEYANSRASNTLGTAEEFETALINGFANAFSVTVGTDLPPYVVEEVRNHIKGSSDMFVKTTDMLLSEPDKVPEFIEEHYIRTMAVRVVSSVIFLVVFFVLMTIVVIVASRSVDFGLLNGYDRLDRSVGGILGLVAAVAGIMIIAVALKIMVNLTDKENSFISLNTIENTKLFRLFYNFL